ncbi:hypothetical protein QCA50_000384 [Cerrena zonata]|uniref:AAA+ ATPase domain-containing protein n=1 Tax=Cerrena zonata TaxID=2478898 RepID=A0AAW0GUG8_9APHY
MAPRNSRTMQDLEDAFVKVSFEDDSATESPQSPTFNGQKDPLFGPWFEHGSAKFTDPTGFGVVALRKLYPNHTITPFLNPNLLGFPDALIQPISPSDLVSNLFFIPLGRAMGRSQGIMVDMIRFGCFQVAWDKYDFLLYIVRFQMGFGETTQQYLVHDGSEEPSRRLLLAAGIWQNDLHEEIYVFNQGFWNKDHNLWVEVQKARWEDVILKEEFKTNLKKDVYGFFDSEDLYKSLSIPWKRGIIMYGPPGNGKTISMKAIIKECDARGYTPLYVRSFQSWMGEEGAMAAVFGKARQMSPCVIILEDLDSLINDRNRSYFLNELDGFEGNDGLLVIGSTNHFDRLDPGLSGRPSRFDRKYEFDDPDEDERKLYAKYWQNKLKSNKQIDFPDSLVNEIAAGTARFSFAYLKEAFVSTLVLLAGWEGDKPTFGDLLKRQIRTLRRQLDKDRESNFGSSSRALPAPQIRQLSGPFSRPERTQSSQQRPEGQFPGYFPQRPTNNQSRVWSLDTDHAMNMPGEMPPPDVTSSQRLEGRRDVRNMALAAAALGRSFIA